MLSREKPSAMQDLDWVSPNLAISGRLTAGDEQRLAQVHGVSRVVDVRSECCDDVHLLRAAGIEHLHVPANDCCGIEQQRIWTALEWIRAALHQGRRVLIHCEHGIGRSATLLACVLVTDGLPPAQALQLLKSSRSQVSPSPVQLHCLLDFVRDWHARSGTPCPTVTWNELADIAYGARDEVASGAA